MPLTFVASVRPGSVFFVRGPGPWPRAPGSQVPARGKRDPKDGARDPGPRTEGRGPARARSAVCEVSRFEFVRCKIQQKYKLFKMETRHPNPETRQFLFVVFQFPLRSRSHPMHP